MGGVSTSQGTQRMAGSPQYLGEKCGIDLPSESPGGNRSAHTVVLDVQALELGENTLPLC